MKYILETPPLLGVHDLVVHVLHSSLENIDTVGLILEASELVLHYKDTLNGSILLGNSFEFTELGLVKAVN